jgi:8-oxo-dGTP pyrophosphatase MutT (NUDIX family)
MASSRTVSSTLSILAVAIAYGATAFAFKKMADQAPLLHTAPVAKKTWIELAQQHGYEGAQIVVTNADNAILFMTSMKDEKLQAEVPGGKIHEVDNGEAFHTAQRELLEECGLVVRSSEIAEVLYTNGGTSGTPSIQYVSTPLDVVGPVKLGEGFMGFTWSKLKDDGKGGFCTTDNIPIRKFNKYFIEQHREKLARFFV